MSSGVALSICFLTCSLAVAQESTFEGLRIESVQYTPSGTLSDRDWDRVRTLKVGSPLRSEDVAEQIDRLFATGAFADIKAEADRSGTGVAVRFVTEPARYISGLQINGKIRNPPNRGELASIPELTRGDVFTDGDLKQAVETIQKTLVANGLYEGTVKSDAKADPSGRQMFITLTVHYGSRAKYETPVVHGDTNLSTDTVVRATGWRMRIIGIWRKVTAARTSNGIAGILRKYQSDDRLEARAEVEKLNYDAGDHRVQPVLNLTPGPRVKITTTETKLSRGTLKKYVPVFEEGAVDNDLLAEGARNLRDYLQSKGYFDAEVDLRTVMPEPDQETVEYAVSQGPRYKLKSVTISGNKYFEADTIRERMFLQPSTFYMRRGRYSDAFAKKDEENITNLYHANGFRDATVKSARVPMYHGKADQIGVVVHIDEGEQWLVDTVAIHGLTPQDLQAVDGSLASSAGQPFSDVSMAADRNAILQYLASNGYPSAEFRVQWQQSGTPHHVNIEYTVTPGQRQFVRKIVITGLRQTRPKLVDHRMTLKAGNPISAVEERNIQQRLYNLGVFSRVDTAIENPDGDTQDKDLLYAFEEANRYTLTIGVGAQVGRFGTPSNTTLTSPGGSTGFSPQFSLNVNRLNFLGIGHTVSLRGAYSTLEKLGSLSYFAPRFHNIDGRNLTYTVLWDQTLDVRTFAAKREEASVQLSQNFSRGSTGLFRFAYRQVSVSNVVIPTLLIPQLLQAVKIGILSANYARDHRDSSTDPHRGSYNTADVSLAWRYFGSQRNFGKVLLRNATYYRLSPKVVLARQTQFGIIEPFWAPAGLSDQASVPLPERFFGGGADSLRAFPYNEAGPRDTGAPLVPGGPSSAPTGFPLGGNALFFNNIELRFPLIGENIGGVLFHDMGNVYSTLSNVSFRFNQRNKQDFDYAVHAVGFGIRYRTPVGPIRGDFAYSINPPSYLGFSGTPVQLLQCGPNSTAANCQSTPQNISHFQFFFSIGQTF